MGPLWLFFVDLNTKPECHRMLAGLSYGQAAAEVTKLAGNVSGES
jgi:hypothetical protein